MTLCVCVSDTLCVCVSDTLCVCESDTLRMCVSDTLCVRESDTLSVCVSHAACVCVSDALYACVQQVEWNAYNIYYGVATMSKLLKILSLFCRRSSLLKKRPVILRRLLFVATL